MTVDLLASAGAWFWDEYGKTLTDKAIGHLKGEWGKFKWGEASHLYKEQVKKLYATTLILGNPKPIVIEDIFTDVYVLDKPTAFRRFNIEKINQITSERSKLHFQENRRHALRLVLEEERLFILGKPGAGKTTFLKYLTLKAVEGKISKTPIFISLRQCQEITCPF